MISRNLEFKKQRRGTRHSSEAPAASVVPVWHRPARGVGTLGARCVEGRRRSCPGRARNLDCPGARGTRGRRRNTPSGAGKPEDWVVLLRPWLYRSLGSTAEGTEKKKEDAAGKRERGWG